MEAYREHLIELGVLRPSKPLSPFVPSPQADHPDWPTHRLAPGERERFEREAREGLGRGSNPYFHREKSAVRNSDRGLE